VVKSPIPLSLIGILIRVSWRVKWYLKEFGGTAIREHQRRPESHDWHPWYDAEGHMKEVRIPF
jgi:hypothetical protein